MTNAMGSNAPSHDVIVGPRFGFTITKKLGNAVVRNRIRRRLKAAIAELSEAHARPGFDYVVVARIAAFDRPYGDIISDLVKAFATLHAGGHSKQGHRSQKTPVKPAGKTPP
jgi:ribonuclease P protein component